MERNSIDNFLHNKEKISELLFLRFGMITLIFSHIMVVSTLIFSHNMVVSTLFFSHIVAVFTLIFNHRVFKMRENGEAMP